MAGHDGGDPSEGGRPARDTDPFARTELVRSTDRPARDTDPFARTEIVGSSPPTAPGSQTPVVVRSGSGGMPVRDDRAERLKKGGVVGRFTVIDVLGQGGMGVVLAAFDPSLDRRVAIKMLHEDVSEGHAARLEREARAMAQLSHPNVVTVHETGTFEGRLYIAMELIEGQTLGQWLKASKRTRARIVEVMLQAGRGLAAAHEVGLVHRDFKPDNVLVGKDGRVRVSDFGLVTAVGDDAAGEGVGGMATGSFAPKSALTMAGSIMGTPLYMAPEQHKGHPADAKADQFSFCVTLWQALTGDAPYAADSYKQLLENLDAGRLRALPRGVSLPSRLRAALTRGLSTAPEARFPTMTALLDELEATQRRTRWPLLAGGGAALAAGGVAAFLLFGRGSERDVCGAGASRLAGVWDAPRKSAIEAALRGSGAPGWEAAWKRIDARIEAHTAAWVGRHRAVCEATHERGEQSQELLDLRMRCLDRHLADLGALVVRLAEPGGPETARIAADATGKLGDFADCDDEQGLRERVPLPDDPALRSRIDALQMKLSEARSFDKLGRYARAREIVAEVALAAPGIGWAPLEAEALLHRAGLEFRSGDLPAAEKTYRAAADAAARARDDARLAQSWIDLIQTLGAMGRHEDALKLVDVASTAAARVTGDVALAARFSNNVAGIHQALGNYLEAKKHYERALELQRSLGEDNPLLPYALTNLATVLWASGDMPKARSMFEEAKGRMEKTMGADHPALGYLHRNLGDLSSSEGNLDGAIAEYRIAVGIFEAANGKDSVDVALALEPLADALARKPDAAAAREAGERALQIREAKLGPDHALVSQVLLVLVGVDLAEGTPEAIARASDRLTRAIAIQEKVYGPDHIQIAYTLDRVAELAQGQGKIEEALAARKRGLAIRQKTLGEGNQWAGMSHYRIAELLMALGRHDEAVGSFELAAASYRGAGGDGGQLAEVDARRAEVRSRQGKHKLALPLFETATAAAVAAGAETKVVQAIRFRHADALVRAGKRAEGIAKMKDVRTVMKDDAAFVGMVDAWLAQ